MEDQTPKAEDLQPELIRILQSEVCNLRELLSSLAEEQQALLNNEAERVRTITQSREALLQTVNTCRDDRVKTLELLNLVITGEKEIPEDLFAIFTGNVCVDCVHILSLRDEICALLDELKCATSRNQYLLENKVQMTKEMIQRLNPSCSNTTYGGDGQVTKTKTKTKTQIVNQEV